MHVINLGILVMSVPRGLRVFVDPLPLKEGGLRRATGLVRLNGPPRIGGKALYPVVLVPVLRRVLQLHAVVPLRPSLNREFVPVNLETRQGHAAKTSSI